MPLTLQGRVLTAGLGSGAVSLGLAMVLLAVFGRPSLPELLLGWGCACLNGAAHAAINLHAVGRHARRFLVWGIVMNALRLGVVLVTLLAVCFLSDFAFAPFAISLAGGAIVFLTGGALAMAGRERTER